MSTITPHEGALLNEHATRLLVRDWVNYLRARLTLLAPEPMTDAFERDAASAIRSQAEEDLAAIPPDTRSLFERAVTQRCEQQRSHIEAEQRAEAGSLPRMADPDLLDRAALQELFAEATEPDETGHILLPAQADHQGIDWLEFRAADLEARPDDRAYRSSRGQADREKRTRVAAGIGALFLTTLAIWMLFRPEEATPTSAHTNASANGVPIIAWPATTLTLIADTEVTLPLSIVDADSWPSDGLAHIRDITHIPLQLCAPTDTFSAVREVQIAGDGSTPDRVYILVAPDAAPATPDLQLAACNDPSISIVGMLQRTNPAPLGNIGMAQRLAEQTINLIAAAVIGPAEVPAVPQGAALVILTLSGDAQDWTATAPMLRLGDGAQYTAPEVRATPEGATELRFLVPAPSETLPAEFRLTDPTTDQVIRWKIEIGPPAERLSVLRKVLTIEGMTVGAANILSVIVTNTGAQPLTLTTADVALEWNGTPTSLLAITGIEAPLEAGETRTLTLSLPPDLTGVATLSIGVTQYRISTS